MLALLLLVACTPDMRDQPRYEPLEASNMFPDNRSARPLADGVIAWEDPVQATFFLTGKDASGNPVDAFPFQVTEEVLKRGQQEFDVNCSPCHGLDGYGQGMIVKRGFSPPPNFHTDRIRQLPAGQIFDVITNGFGQMYSYGYRVKPADRWAIVAYIRALQLSQNATTQDVPPDQLQQLQSSNP